MNIHMLWYQNLYAYTLLLSKSLNKSIMYSYSKIIERRLNDTNLKPIKKHISPSPSTVNENPSVQIYI